MFRVRKDPNLHWHNETKLIGNNEKIDSYSLAVENVDLAYSGRKYDFLFDYSVTGFIFL